MIKSERRENGTLRVQTINIEPSMTQQQFKDECDINNIMRKYKQTGSIPNLRMTAGQYADVSEVQDYQGMLDTVIAAQNAFMTLPAEARMRFQNDPAQLISFLQKEENYDEALKLGLVNKREIPAKKQQNDDSTTIQ